MKYSVTRVVEIARAIEKFIDNCPFSESEKDLIPLALRALADEYEMYLSSALTKDPDR